MLFPQKTHNLHPPSHLFSFNHLKTPPLSLKPQILRKSRALIFTQEMTEKSSDERILIKPFTKVWRDVKQVRGWWCLIILKVSFCYNFITMSLSNICSVPQVDYESPLKDTRSVQTDSSQRSESRTDVKESMEIEEFLICGGRQHLFDADEKICQFSTKINKKAISWIMAICWSKSYSQESLWTTLMMFYAYKSKRAIDKTQLEAILLVCLQLSTKLCEPSPLLTSDLLQNITRPVSRQDLMDIETKVLQIMDYNLYVDHEIFALLRRKHWQEEITQKFLYLCELYLMRGHHILFDRQKLDRLAGIIQNCCSYEECELEYLEIKEMMAERDSKILVNKFGAKFDIDSFRHEFE